jgi:hypothetical protein
MNPALYVLSAFSLSVLHPAVLAGLRSALSLLRPVLLAGSRPMRFNIT